MIDKFFGFLTRIVNLNRTELLPVFISWVLSFLVRFAVVVGFTVMTVYFTVNYGIYSLALLFIVHSLAIIFGSVLFSPFVNRIKREFLVIILSLLAAFVLIIGAHFYAINELYFLICCFVALSVLTGQLKIVRMVFTEEMFSPSQSNRVFPVIESAETIGIILGGLVFTFYSSVMDLDKFLYIWAISLVMIVPVVFFYLSRSVAIPFKEITVRHAEVDSKSSRLENLKHLLHKFSKSNFIVTLIIVMLLQWSFVSVMEFQYTKAVEEALHPVLEVGQVMSQMDSNAFAMELGSIQAGIGGLTLIFQLIIASRVLSFLGVTGSFLVYPIVVFCSLISMFLNYGLVSAVTTKFSQEISNVLHYNAYHSSYYIIKHKFRAIVAELIEGFIRPVGAIIGTIFVLFADLLTSYFDSDKFLTLVAMVIVMIMFFVTLKLKSFYEEAPRHDLLKLRSISDMLNAVDVMLQNRSPQDIKFLMEFLNSDTDIPVPVVEKIFDCIGKYGDADVFPDFLIYLENTKYVTLASLDALNSIILREYSELKKHRFTWYGLKQFYNKLLLEVIDSELRGKILSVLVLIEYKEGKIDSVVKLLKSEKDEFTLSCCIEVLSPGSDKYLLKLIYPFLNNYYSSIPLLEFAYEYLSEADFMKVIEAGLNSKNIKYVCNCLIFICKNKFESDYMYLVLKTNLKLLKNIEVLFLYNLITAPNDLHSSIDKLLISDLFKLNEIVLLLGDKNIFKIFARKIENEIQNLFSEINNEESLVDCSDQLLLLQDLYSLLGSEKEYFMIKEYLSLSVA